MTEIILASASPRRRELMKLIASDFRISPADVDETVPCGMDPFTYAVYVSEKKAESCAEKNKTDGIYIGCDTSVIAGDMILGKPADEKDAFRMLKMLSGKKHFVITGVCILKVKDGKEVFKTSFSEKTDVEFYDLSDEEIAGYVSSGEPMDKAGAYGIQEKGSLLVRRIDGDFFNVIGLPSARLSRELKKIID